MKNKTTPSEIDTLLQRLDAQDTQLAAQSREMERLRALVEPDHKRDDGPARSRRDVLRLAGAAVMGAAGAAALRVVPAAAANGDPVTVGNSFTGTAMTRITAIGASAFDGQAESDGFFGVGGAAAGVGGTGTYGVATNTNGIGAIGQGSGAGGLGGQFFGLRAPVQLLPALLAGPPFSFAHSIGDLWTDKQGIVWACVAAGTPGVFAPLQTGGANISHFVKVSNLQYHLPHSDGQTWVDMDATNLSQSVTPLFDSQAVISVSTDLWTANAGFNQDIGIFISGGAFGPLGTGGTIVAWKESGGSAGTFSPNAAFVETTQPLEAGMPYTIKVRWKTNKPAGVATIFAGAGPLPLGSAGGGVAGQVSPTRLATHLVVDVPSPSVLHIPANDPSATPPPRPLRPRP